MYTNIAPLPPRPPFRNSFARKVKQIGVVRSFVRKWTASKQKQKCDIMVCDESKEAPVDFTWKRGDKGFLRVAYFTWVGAELSEGCPIMECAHGKSH